MPLYEYECDANGHRFEVIQKYSDAPIDVCPKCGSAVHKLMSSPAIQFKGSGWYITDYARKTGDGKDAKAAKEGESKESKESKDSKDTKETKETKSETQAKSDSPASSSSSSSTPKSD
jgi:putative FmdB family regulatory protein